MQHTKQQQDSLLESKKKKISTKIFRKEIKIEWSLLRPKLVAWMVKLQEVSQSMKEKYKEMETMKENIRAMENISRKPNM